MSEYSLEDARTVVENSEDFSPMTWNPWFNFLIDVAMGLVERDEWDELKELYQEEVEVYNREDVDAEPYEVEELLS